MVLQFHRPQTIEEAVELKARLGEEAHFLAGGTELNPRLVHLGAKSLIALAALKLDRIEYTEDAFVIGSCCTIQSVIDARELPACVRAAARQVANRNIRNVATIGGQLAGSRRCSDTVPVLVALEATVDVAKNGADAAMLVLEYVQGDERPLVKSVRIAKRAASRRVAVGREARNANSTAWLTVAVSMFRSGETITDPIVALCGVSPRVVRLSTVEQQLRGRGLPPQEEIERAVASALPAVADDGGAAGLRNHLASVLVARITRDAYAGQGVATR